jgi:uncharacterized membrane protein
MSRLPARRPGLVLWADAALIVTILILGVSFRFYHLDGKIYDNDEVYTSLRIAGYIGAEIKAEHRALDVAGWQRYQHVGPDRGLVPLFRALLDDMHPPLYFLGAYWWGEGLHRLALLVGELSRRA